MLAILQKMHNTGVKKSIYVLSNFFPSSNSNNTNFVVHSSTTVETQPDTSKKSITHCHYYHHPFWFTTNCSMFLLSTRKKPGLTKYALHIHKSVAIITRTEICTHSVSLCCIKQPWQMNDSSNKWQIHKKSTIPRYTFFIKRFNNFYN